MGWLDRLFGTEPVRRHAPSAAPPAYAVAPAQRAGVSGQPEAASAGDEQALARYRYLLRTAPPEAIERVHAEAFAALTPDQRRQLLGELSVQLPIEERPADADPQTMARAATRAEYMHPGFLERNFSPRRSGPGFGAMVGASALGSIIGYVTTAAIMAPFIGADFGYANGYADGQQADGGSSGSDAGAASDTSGGTDAGAADFGGNGDLGGGFGDMGGFGGGDFGGFDI